ncbi:unnamed protein product [Eruca vesicaria subsp. sativa]|uniref:RNA polymerase sigma-70 region 3 domain-containing protein n=1 Tax=Eruca vesicaria subsp. sativa TaxID=29727 RepID=A0ABC8L3D5_ERUVS|nr:unnamed protein product [Eruca vesicaria subsp. sativa]
MGDKDRGFHGYSSSGYPPSHGAYPPAGYPSHKGYPPHLVPTLQLLVMEVIILHMVMLVTLLLAILRITRHLIKLEKVKTKLESQNGREPTIAEWAEALWLSGPVLKSEIYRGRSSREKLITANLRLVVHIAKQYQNRGLNFQDLLQVSSQTNYRPSKEELASHVGVSTEKLDKLMYNTRTPLSMQQPIWSDQDITFQEVTPDSGIETPDMSVWKQMMRNHVRNLLNVLSPKERKIIKLWFGIDGGKQRSLFEIGEIYGLS